MTGRFPCVILAGGRSSRMGEAKALLPFGNVRLIDHVAARLAPQASRLFVNANDPGIGLPGMPRIADRVSGHQGPLAGLHAALCHVAETEPDRPTHLLTAPVDCPFLPLDLADRLAAALASPDHAVIASSGGHLHPVIGLWPLSALPRLIAWLADPPTLKVRAFLDEVAFEKVDFPMIETALGPVDPFFNINTKGDLDFALRLREAVAAT